MTPPVPRSQPTTIPTNHPITNHPVVSPDRPTPPEWITTVRPVTYQDLTGLPEEIAYQLVKWRRLGQLSRHDQPVTHPDGTVTVRAYLTTLPALPAPAAVPQEQSGWDRGDYVYVGLRATQALVFGGIATTLVVGITSVLTWIGLHAHTLATAAVITTAVLVLMTLGRGRCAGIVMHCGGCPR